jgi:alpha-ketoglutarate-dependent 2,4-dichlorophenoxyacetate dioxygenase
MPVSIRPLHPVFVGEVTGIDCREPLRQDEAAAIEAGIDQYAVLVLRKQKHLDARRQKKIMKN